MYDFVRKGKRKGWWWRKEKGGRRGRRKGVGMGQWGSTVAVVVVGEGECLVNGKGRELTYFPSFSILFIYLFNLIF